MIWPWQDRKHGVSPLKASFFALMFAPALLVTWQFATRQFGPLPLAGMTYWSGVWTMWILLLALAVTPAMKIFRWKRLALVRRMIGVTALAYTVAHLIIYFALRLWDFPAIGVEMITRFTLIVATISMLGLIPLAATSVDAAVKRMGAAGWQRLHNTVYATTFLALFHYLLSPGVFPDQYLMGGIFFWLMLWRVLDRRGLGVNPLLLAILAVAAALFAVLLEVGWTWAYHGFDPAQTLANNFSLAFGFAPVWKLLAGGILIALIAAIRHSGRAEPAKK